MASDLENKKVWFITGASSGLGLAMGLSALRSGHRVIGTGRDIQKAAREHPEFENLGGQWMQLDVSQPESQQTLEDRIEREETFLGSTNRIHWVVVNNAGHTLVGTVEDMSEQQILQYLQTNLFGFIRVWKVMLPTLRRHRGGTLMTVSSLWGFVSKAEHMLYSAAKATTESLTESYANLLAPFGIRTMILEPGGFRTPFAGNHAMSDGGISEDYRDKISQWKEVIAAASEDPTIVNGDPTRFGAAVVDAVDEHGLFRGVWAKQQDSKALRVQLGSDCYGMIGDRLKDLIAGHSMMANIAKSTDVDGGGSGSS